MTAKHGRQERRGLLSRARRPGVLEEKPDLSTLGKRKSFLTQLWGLSSKEQRRPQARAGETAFRPGGPGKAFPPGLQAQCPVSVGQASLGASPSPSPLGVIWGGGGCEGMGQAPPPRPAATEPSGSNIPSPLKGKVAASKLRLSKALQLGGEDPAREGKMNSKRLFLALLSRL